MELNKIYKGNCLEVMKTFPDNSIDAIVTDPPYGISFMGKSWDYDVPTKEIWKECFRVLKPGGHLLSFAGTKTQHRMAVNIEDAGFEIRDMLAWIYGNGFPKGINISKQLNKINDNITVTEWTGWNTSLKPSFEPITMARKPISEKTIAENCLKWNTGAINIDACRIDFVDQSDIKQYDINRRGITERSTQKVAGDNITNENVLFGGWKVREPVSEIPQGRYPANLIHDGSEEALEIFPHSKSGAMKKEYTYTNTGYSLGAPSGKTKYKCESSEGSASRFFYCAKASRSERNAGCDDLEYKENAGTYKFREDGSLDGKPTSPKKNFHPTVKPIKLMEYLVKLVSREDSIILDPFIGSGTTALACIRNNRNFIGIEQNEEYIEIANNRIKYEMDNKKLI